jgi:meso-butanediol dehydrogenase / (S,S)-butanediol dehydrogenase / diacetyl reductase
MSLAGRTVIVTGAGSGIGRATAQRLAREGARLVLNDANEEYLTQILKSIEPADHVAVLGDVADEATAVGLAENALARFGRIDGLVNNAGIHFVGDPTDVSLDDWNRILAVNLTSMFLCAKHVLPAMVEQRAGSIVNLASISSFVGQEFGESSTFVYNVTKAGALQLAVSLATRYASHGIRVNAVCPGATRTQQIRHLWPDQPREEEDQLWSFVGRELTPLGRVGHPDDIAAAITWLLSDESAFVTGTHLVVDGGYLAR